MQELLIQQETFQLHIGETFLASRDRLREHPENMRRYYRQSDLTEMAASLAAHSNDHPHGNLQALQVLAADDGPLAFRRDASTGRVHLVEGTLFVVDGNLRFRSGAILKDQCPPYKCELISATQAQQLLTMTIANTVRYDPDAISEALHYARLRDEEGLPVRQISVLTGVYEKRITDRLALLELDEPIRKLMGEDRLSHDARVCRALLAVPDRKARVKLAERLADEGATIKAIEAACANLVTALGAAERKRARGRDPHPMTGHAAGHAGRKVDDEATPIPWATVREAAATMCAVCELKQKQLTDVQEPAWTLLAHAAHATCNNCPVREVANACRACPGVELLKRVILQVMPREKAGS